MKIKSSHLVDIKYRFFSRNLFVTFKNNDTYAYINVPFSKFIGLILSKSKGSYFHKNIRNDYLFRIIS